MNAVWKIRAAEGHGDGWLREWADGPIVTADEHEAEQFASAADAMAMLHRVNGDGRIPMVVVARPATPRVMHGPASAATPLDVIPRRDPGPI